MEQETEKATRLAELNSEETGFGMPVDYLREFERIDTLVLHLDDGLPVLILQGEKDRQVTMTDFALWQEGLADHPNAQFTSYPALNHLFGAYTGAFESSEVVALGINAALIAVVSLLLYGVYRITLRKVSRVLGVA